VHIRYCLHLLLIQGLCIFGCYQAFAQTAATEKSYPFKLEKNEQLIYLQQNNQLHTAFMVKYDTKLKTARLKAVQYGPASNKIIRSAVIDSARIGNWQKSPFKGSVKQSYENAVMSAQALGEQIPLEYQYQVSVSPDKQTTLCYRYDYSQPTLYIQAFLLNSHLDKKPPLQLPVDEGLIHHQAFINNHGDIFLLHTDPQDGILLIRYQPDIDHSTLLEIAASSSRRHSFLPHIADHETVYIANVTELHDNLSGVMYSKFNFASQRVEEVQYHILSKEMQEKVNASSNKGRFHLTSFSVTPQKYYSLELQKKNIEATGYTYDPYATNDPLQWRPRKIQVRSGEKLHFQFDSTGKLVSEKFNP
jgi:hypothetical protein